VIEGSYILAPTFLPLLPLPLLLLHFRNSSRSLHAAAAPPPLESASIALPDSPSSPPAHLEPHSRRCTHRTACCPGSTRCHGNTPAASQGSGSPRSDGWCHQLSMSRTHWRARDGVVRRLSRLLRRLLLLRRWFQLRRWCRSPWSRCDDAAVALAQDSPPRLYTSATLVPDAGYSRPKSPPHLHHHSTHSSTSSCPPCQAHPNPCTRHPSLPQTLLRQPRRPVTSGRR